MDSRMGKTAFAILVAGAAGLLVGIEMDGLRLRTAFAAPAAAQAAPPPSDESCVSSSSARIPMMPSIVGQVLR